MIISDVTVDAQSCRKAVGFLVFWLLAVRFCSVAGQLRHPIIAAPLCAAVNLPEMREMVDVLNIRAAGGGGGHLPAISLLSVIELHDEDQRKAKDVPNPMVC